MKLIKPHPIAAMFPRLGEKELHDLALSIEESGLKDPIVLHEGKILDGINRQAACLRAKREPRYVKWDGKGTLLEFVLAKNLYRRHLNESQRALVAASALEQLEKEARARAKAGTPAPPGRAKGRAVDIAGAAAKVSGRTVSRAKTLLENAPKAEIEAIRSGDKTLKQVEREIKRAVQVKQAKAYVPPTSRFQVITVDFSWPYRDKLDGSDLVRGGPPYPPQTLEEIVAFIRGPLAKCCDERACVLGNWITGPISLDLTIAPVVQREIEALGFKPLHERIWEKEEISGKDFTGLGRGIRWNAEKLQLFVRGAVVINEMGKEHGRPLQSTVFRAPIGEHSEKPQKAYDDLEQLVPYTKRLEMFARVPRKGWVTSGSELAKTDVDAEAVASTGGELWACPECGHKLMTGSPAVRLNTECPSCREPREFDRVEGKTAAPRKRKRKSNCYVVDVPEAA